MYPATFNVSVHLLPTSARLLLVYGLLKGVHIALAAVKCSSGDVHTHGVDTHIV